MQVLLQERTIELELERARRQALQQALLEAEERARLLAQDREQLADRHRAELEDLAAACDAELAEARGLHCREVAELAAAYEAQLEGTQDQVAMLEDRLNVTQYGGTPMGELGGGSPCREQRQDDGVAKWGAPCLPCVHFLRCMLASFKIVAILCPCPLPIHRTSQYSNPLRQGLTHQCHGGPCAGPV